MRLPGSMPSSCRACRRARRPPEHDGAAGEHAVRRPFTGVAALRARGLPRARPVGCEPHDPRAATTAFSAAPRRKHHMGRHLFNPVNDAQASSPSAPGQPRSAASPRWRPPARSSPRRRSRRSPTTSSSSPTATSSRSRATRTTSARPPRSRSRAAARSIGSAAGRGRRRRRRLRDQPPRRRLLGRRHRRSRSRRTSSPATWSDQLPRRRRSRRHHRPGRATSTTDTVAERHHAHRHAATSAPSVNRSADRAAHRQPGPDGHRRSAGATSARCPAR